MMESFMLMDASLGQGTIYVAAAGSFSHWRGAPQPPCPYTCARHPFRPSPVCLTWRDVCLLPGQQTASKQVHRVQPPFRGNCWCGTSCHSMEKCWSGYGLVPVQACSPPPCCVTHTPSWLVSGPMSYTPLCHTWLVSWFYIEFLLYCPELVLSGNPFSPPC